MASISSSHTAYLVSESDKALDPHCTRCQLLVLGSSCKRANPRPCLEASVSSLVSLLESKFLSTKGPVRIVLTSLKAFCFHWSKQTPLCLYREQRVGRLPLQGLEPYDQCIERHLKIPSKFFCSQGLESHVYILFFLQ